MGFLQATTKLDPLKSFNARIDPLMNKLGAYGKNAPTPWDPLAVKAGAFGYDVVGPAADPTASMTAQQQASAFDARQAASTADLLNGRRRAATAASAGATSSDLLGS